MPVKGGVIKGYLVEIGTGIYREITYCFPAEALLPVIGNIFYFVFFTIPDKCQRLDLAVFKPGKYFNSFV